MTLTQSGPFQLASGLDGTQVALDRFDGEEGLSMPYLFTVDLLSEINSLDPTLALSKPMVIQIDLGDGTLRYIHGIVRRFTQLDIFNNLTRYRAEIVPKIWFMSLVADCRIYQQETAKDIISAVLARNNVSDFQFNLVGTPGPKRDYTVQYRESDLQFISRLMQEEGWFYSFRHAKDKHTLFICDNNGESAIPYIVGNHALDSVPGAVGGATVENVVSDLRQEYDVVTTKYSLVDFNPVTSPVKPFESQLGTQDLAIRDYPAKTDTADDADRYTRLRLDAAQALNDRVIGASNCRAFVTGARFDLKGYYRTDVNKTYQLYRVRHTATAGALGTPSQGSTAYANQFIALPATVTYRPTQTVPRPHIAGTQTAMVVGADGTTSDDGGIVVDKYGRVKVIFHWSSNGEISSWVRVASTWAGKQWGQIQIPRVGQEIIVSFEEGDPDRPIIVGRVYNADEMPLYTLPDNKTQSGIKTRSSPNGGTDDYNELRFEDKMGSEQIVIHAQKDLLGTVENDQTYEVGGNDTLTVDKGNQTIKIKQGNHTFEVTQGKSTTTIFDDTSREIKQGNVSEKVSMGNVDTKISMGNVSTKLDMGNWSLGLGMGNVSVKCDLGTVSVESMQGITLTCGQSSIKIDQMGVTISGMMIKLDGQVQTQVSGLMTQLSADAMMQVSGAIMMIG